MSFHQAWENRLWLWFRLWEKDPAYARELSQLYQAMVIEMTYRGFASEGSDDIEYAGS